LEQPATNIRTEETSNTDITNLFIAILLIYLSLIFH
jgi:hypothetical protein